MNEVSLNKQAKLSPHFTLGELTKTSYHTLDGNIPSRVAIENLKRVCGWLEILRERYNAMYGDQTTPSCGHPSYSGGEIPIVIRCYGPEQMIRYACLLLDTADENGWVFDELIQEKRGTTYWIHFAVRPKDNRRKILFDCR